MQPNQTESKTVQQTEGGGAVASSDLLCASMLMQGLLASGHYTNKVRDDGDDEPEIRRYDNGKEWKEDGFERRFEAHVVGDAIGLLEELKRRMERDSA